MNGKSKVEELLEMGNLLQLYREQASKPSPECEAEIFQMFLYGHRPLSDNVRHEPWPGLAWSRYHYNPGPHVPGLEASLRRLAGGGR